MISKLNMDKDCRCQGPVVGVPRQGCRKNASVPCEKTHIGQMHLSSKKDTVFSGRTPLSIPAGPERSARLLPGRGRSLPDTLEKIRGMCLFDIRHSPAADRNLIVVLKKNGIIINLLHILKVYNDSLRAGHEKII